MYEYVGCGKTRDEELEMGCDSVFVYDGVGVFGEFVGLSGDELILNCTLTKEFHLAGWGTGDYLKEY